MNRKEITEMLSKLTEKRLNSQYKFWASEVTLDKYISENRVDYLGFNPKYIDYKLYPTSVDLGQFDCYEVKSCMNDYTSGNGLNFYGDNNYLVCTNELAEQLSSVNIDWRISKVLVPDKPCNKLITKFDCRNPHHARERVASELLWAMIIANKEKVR